MNIAAKSGPSYKGHYFTDHPGTYGELKSSADLAGDGEALRARMEQDGYLYLPGLLDRDRVDAAANAMIDLLASRGALDPDAPRSEAVIKPGVVLHEVVPDRRPEANLGYFEIVDHDTSDAVPVLMQPGDLLVFHSHLMHRSTDNESAGLRAAMVFHYAQAGTVDRARNPAPINDWMPVRRASSA